MSVDCVLMATIGEFSNEGIHRPGQLSELTKGHMDSSYFKDRFNAQIYANGNNDKNKGHISLVFAGTLPFRLKYYRELQFSCGASVIDANGEKHFTRIFTFEHCFESKGSTVFTVDRYIARESLNKESPLLLPNDCLTLRIDMTINKPTLDSNIFFQIENVVLSSFSKEESSTNETVWKLNLHSEVGQRLCKVSPLFYDLVNLTVSNDNYFQLYRNEYMGFTKACNIVMGTDSITVQSLDDVYEISIIADKYNIPPAIETCRHLMKSFLCAESEEILKHAMNFAEKITNTGPRYEDDDLMKIFKIFIERNKGENIKKMDLHELSPLEWTCEITGTESFLYFTLLKKETPEFEYNL